MEKKIKKFNFAKDKTFTVKEIIENIGEPLEWEWDRGDCPHCHQRIFNIKNYTIVKIEILESDDGDIEMIGYTKELIDGKPLTMRLPNSKFCNNKDMTSIVKEKSKYLKNNGGI